MTPEDILDAERQFAETVSNAREGSVIGIFLVTVHKDDSADSYFAGEDGQQATAGLGALSSIAEWLVQNGCVMELSEMLSLGDQIRKRG